ncbi:MAG: recombinase RecA [Streptococcaceae bacterium]|nr:recombinase RecA [Streptococcaceae bacterium]
MAAKTKKKLEDVTKKYGEERDKALQRALEVIEKDFGKGALMRMGESANQKVQVMSSGSLALDIALGAGGYPKGRIIEIFGPESSGKTTVALHAVAQAQKEGGIAAFIDAENALDPAYAQALGVDIDQLLLSQPDSGEQGLQIAEKLIESGAIDIVVIDSVAALVPRAEIDGEIGDSNVGLQARMMSQAMRKLASYINRTKTIAIFINQLREKVGVMFGSPETTPGGRALKFYASVRLDVRGSKRVEVGTGDDKEAIGKETKIKVVKNKVAPPFKQANVEIMYGQGISREGELLTIATDLDIIHKSGAWFAYKDEKIAQGAEKARNYLKENPDVFAEIDKAVREHYGLPITGGSVEAENKPEEPSEKKPAKKSSKKTTTSKKSVEPKEEKLENEQEELELEPLEIEE